MSPHPIREARDEGTYDDTGLVLLEPPGLDVALLGVWHDDAGNPRAVYSWGLLVGHFVTLGATEEDADEWVSFNVEGLRVSSPEGRLVQPILVTEL